MKTKKLYIVAFTLVAVIGLGSMASAQDRTRRIDWREHNQQARVAAGIRNGSISPGEASRIERNEARIRRDEFRAKADGVVTPRERARINRELNYTNREIWRDAHDGRYHRW